jgi:hypothetical protein
MDFGPIKQIKLKVILIYFNTSELYRNRTWPGKVLNRFAQLKKAKAILHH